MYCPYHPRTLPRPSTHAWDNGCNPLPAPQTLQTASLEEVYCGHTVDLFCVLCCNSQLCQDTMQF